MKQQIPWKLILLISTPLFTSLANADNASLSAWIARTEIHGDNFLEIAADNAKYDDYSAAFAISTQYKLSSIHSLGLEIGSHGKFTSKSNEEDSSRSLSVNDLYAQLTAQQSFAFGQGRFAYLREGLGVARISQELSQRNNLINSYRTKTELNDTTLLPSLSIGFRKETKIYGRPVALNLEWRYSGYRLENQQDDFDVRYGALRLGFSTQF